MSSWSFALKRCQIAVKVPPPQIAAAHRLRSQSLCLCQPWHQVRASASQSALDYNKYGNHELPPHTAVDTATLNDSPDRALIVRQPLSLILFRSNQYGGQELSLDTTGALDESHKVSGELYRMFATDTLQDLFAATWLEECDSSYVPRWEEYFSEIFGAGWRDKPPYYSVYGSIWAMGLLRRGSLNAIREKWLETPEDIRSIRWPTIMLSCLTRSARGSLLLLSSLTKPSFGIMMDCLLYLKRSYWPEISKDPLLLKLYYKLLAYERLEKRWPQTRMEQRHLDLFLEEVTPQQGQRLFERFKAFYSGVPFSVIKKIRWLDYFIAVKNVPSSLEAFRMLPPALVAASRPEVLSRCTNLLQLDTIVEDGTSQNFAILPRLLELGMKPNLIIHNVVIKNAFEAGMSGVGWDLYRFMQRENLPTDAYTYVALLRDALSHRNMQQLDELFTAIHHRSDLFQNPYIVVNTVEVVRHIHRHQQGLGPDEAFSHMLAVYTRAFNSEPLQVLGMMAGFERMPENAVLPKPSPRTLAFIIRSYILVQGKARVVKRLWNKLLEEVQAGDILFTEVMREEIVYNGFAIFYSQSVGTLPNCLQVLQYMLDSPYCKPTTRTWGIVLLAYMKYGHNSMVKKIRAEMTSWGVVPDEETQGLISERFSRTHMREEAQEALDRLGSAVELKPAAEVSRQDDVRHEPFWSWSFMCELENHSERLSPEQFHPDMKGTAP